MSNLATIVNNILADSGIDDINVVVTTGSYSNPAWITALSWTKITDRPTTLGGYGITDAYTQTQVDTLLAAKQNTLSLTTTGTSGAATLIGATLNIPQYQTALTNPVTGTGAAGQVAFWNGTTTQTGDNGLFWDNTNKSLGVGTNAPASKLEIRGLRSATKNNLLSLSKFDYGVTNFFQNYSNTFFTNGKSLEIEIETLPLLQLATNNAGTEGRVVFPNGNVGIGTNAPLTLNSLQVSRNINDQNIVSVENVNTGTGAYAELQIRNTNANNSTSLRVMTMGTGYTTAGGFVQNSGVLNADVSLTGGLSIMTRAAADIRFYTNGHTNERWRITSTGVFQSNGAQTIQTSTGNLTIATAAGNGHILLIPNGTGDVGVGTSTPNAILTSANTGALTLNSNDGNHTGFGLFIQAPQTINTVNSAIGFGQTSGRKLAAIGMQTYADADQAGLNFYVQTTATGSVATLTEAMRITSAGNVGIGTTEPAKRLSIQGTDNNFIRLSHASRIGFFDIEHSGVNSDNLVFIQNNGTTSVTSYLLGRDQHIWSTAGTERMRITSSGNVGIGITPASTVLLDLKEPDAATDLIIGLSAGTGARSQIRSIAQVLGSTSELSFHTVNANVTGERMRIFSDGNVLIQSGGTVSNNGARLQVSGAANVGGNLSVNSGGTANSFISVSGSTGSYSGVVSLQRGGTEDGVLYTASSNYSPVTGVSAADIVLYAAGGGRSLRFATSSSSVALTLASSGAATFTSSVTATNGLFIIGTNQNTIGSGLLSLINFSAYNSSANQSIQIGLALDTAVNNNMAYNYLLNVGGNADGQELTLSSRRRGIADLTILSVNGSNGAATFSSSVTATNLLTTSMSGSAINIRGDESLNSNFGITWTTPTYNGGIAAIRVARRGGADASDMMFFTSPNGDIPSERMRITSDGAIGFNGSSAIGNAGLDKMSMGYLNSNYGWIQTWNATPLILNGSGNNVGIGTLTPSEKLEVQDGYISTYHNANINDAGYGVLFYTNGGGSKNSLAGITLSQVGTARSGNLLFQTSNSGAPTTKMTITSGGNVGIGTASPRSIDSTWGILTINGNSSGSMLQLRRGEVNAGYLYSDIFGTTLFETRASSLVFGTNDTARLTITSSGNVGIGVTTPQTKLHIDGVLTFTETGFPTVRLNQIASFHSDGSSPNNNLRFLVSNGSGVTSERMRINGDGNVLIGTQTPNGNTLRVNGTIWADGNISSTGDVIAFASSDRRLKDDITTIENPLEKISKIGGYSFTWNSNQDTYSGKDYGVVAQEIEAIFPELVRNRDTGYKAVKYEKLIPLLIESIKELNKKVGLLELK